VAGFELTTTGRFSTDRRQEGQGTVNRLQMNDAIQIEVRRPCVELDLYPSRAGPERCHRSGGSRSTRDLSAVRPGSRSGPRVRRRSSRFGFSSDI
jgi:hypothetical protein